MQKNIEKEEVYLTGKQSQEWSTAPEEHIWKAAEAGRHILLSSIPRNEYQKYRKVDFQGN